MHRRLAAQVSTALSLLTLWAASGCSATGAAVTGQYRATAGQNAELTVSARGDVLRISLKGGAGLDGGGATAGDCEAVAEGKLQGNVLNARLIPFDSDVVSLTAADIARMDSKITVSFEGNRALVQGRFTHCGLRNVLAGPYERKLP